MINDIRYISAKQLVKKRGWSRIAIRDLLKTSDANDTKISHGKPVKLYNIDRIKQIEKTDRFFIYKKYIERRRVSNLIGRKRRRNKFSDFLDSININIQKTDIDLLKKIAENNYFGQKSHMEIIYGLTDDINESHEDFINRITVEYLRNSFNTYDKILEEQFDRMDTTQAYIELNKKIFSEIGKNYSELKLECEKQLDERIKQLICRKDKKGVIDR